MSNNRYFGCHVSASGGLQLALERAQSLHVNTMQIHPSAPQRWNLKPYQQGIENTFNTNIKNSDIEKIFFHGIYLLNLANPDEEKRKLARASLCNDLDLCNRINGDGVIFHVGSLKDEPDEITGLKRCAKEITTILAESLSPSRLILEVSAGSGRVIGSKMEQLAKIYELCKAPERLGFALDTQHMWASGYNFTDNLSQIVSDIDQQFGFSKVWAIHLNDSKSTCGSCIDRHENLGFGLIGEKTLKNFLFVKELNHIPLILETPRMKSVDEAILDITTLKNYLFN
jgi:deoxyribonuclease IV